MKLKSNAANMIDIQSKMKMIEALQLQQSSLHCDEACNQKQGQEMERLLAEVESPMHEVVQNCQTNFDTYTTEFEPDLDHVKLMTREVMKVDKMVGQLSEYHASVKGPESNKMLSTDKQSLNQLKKDMGIEDQDYLFFDKIARK